MASKTLQDEPTAASRFGGDAGAFMGGLNLAAQLLSGLADAGSDACIIDAQHRTGRQRTDATVAALMALQTASPDFLLGFAAVLTDMLGCEHLPGSPAEYYAGLSPEQCGLGREEANHV